MSRRGVGLCDASLIIFITDSGGPGFCYCFLADGSAVCNLWIYFKLHFSSAQLFGSLPKLSLGEIFTNLHCMGDQVSVFHATVLFGVTIRLVLGSDRWKHFATVTTGACTGSEIQTQDVINLGGVWNDIPGRGKLIPRTFPWRSAGAWNMEKKESTVGST